MRKIAVTLIALAVLAPMSASAQEASETVAKVGETSVSSSKKAARLNLTETQKEKFYEMKNKMFEQIGPKRLAISEQERLLKDLLTQDSLDRKAILEAQDKINSMKSDLANTRIAFRMDFQEQLSPEQRKLMRYSGLKGGKHHGRGKAGKHHKRGLTDRIGFESSQGESANL